MSQKAVVSLSIGKCASYRILVVTCRPKLFIVYYGAEIEARSKTAKKIDGFEEALLW